MILFAPIVQETPHDAALRAFDAIERRDAATLHSYLGYNEALKDRLIEKRLAAFLKGPFAARMAPFRPSPIEFGIDDEDFVFASRIYRAVDGRSIALRLSVRSTSEGPRLAPLFQPLAHAYFDTWAKPYSRASAWATGARLGGPALTKIGIPGMTDKLHDGKVRFYTWPEWAAAVR